MLQSLLQHKQKVVVIGDVHVSPAIMEEAMRASVIPIESVTQLFWGTNNNDDFAVQQLKIERGGPEAAPYAEGLAEAIETADILFTHFSPLPAALLEKAAQLKAIFTCRGGVEHIAVDAATAKGVPVVHVIRNAVPVAEFTLGMILSVTRNIALAHHQLIAGNWVLDYPNAPYITTLNNLTVGLVGMGNIGIELAVRLQALGVLMLAYDEYMPPDTLQQNGLTNVRMVESLEDVFCHADIVSLHARLTDKTAGMVNKKYFSLMKPSAYFINTARGGLVNYTDLFDALASKKIAGAAIDVFETEPLAKNSPLLGLPNITITPHIAGRTEDAIARSPFLLAKEVDKAIKQGTTARIINAKTLKYNNK